MISRSESVRSSSNSRLPYDIAAVEACVSRIQTVSFGQIISISNGTRSVNINAISSGWSIGACNWIIQHDHAKIAYIAASSPVLYRTSYLPSFHPSSVIPSHSIL
jgi:Cft2 family RNA processing exonuclease